MANKREGQIWIGRREPYTVKYQAGGIEYWLQTISTYLSSGTTEMGQLVALNTGDSERVSPAQWPRDAKTVIGIALNSATNGETIRVGNYGFFRFDNLAILQNAFTTHSDLTATAALTGSSYYSAFGNTTADGGAGNDWQDSVGSKNGIGQPVYWFTGRTLKTGASTYSWVDPSAHPGRLTFATPTGYKGISGTEVPWSDDELNTSYTELPSIGTVADYEYDGAGELTSLVVHVNISTFEKRIGFVYPAAGLGEYAATPTAPPSEELRVLRHGLFPNTGTSAYPSVDLVMWGYTDSDVDTGVEGEAFRVYPGTDSYLTTDNRRTEIEIASDTSFFYKLHGAITYSS